MQREVCGGHWETVRKCLETVEQLEVRHDEIVLVSKSKLGDEALDSIADAVKVLMDDGCDIAASALICMCQPKVLLPLLHKCSADHVARLMTTRSEDVGKSMDEGLVMAGKGAVRRHEFPEFFQLMSLGSTTAQAELTRTFPLFTKALACAMKEPEFTKAVRITLDGISKLKPDEYQARLHALLTTATDLQKEFPERALTMKCLVWPAVDENAGLVDKFAELRGMAWLPALAPELLGRLSAELQSEAPRVALMQAVNGQPDDKKVDRLRELVVLSSELNAQRGMELKLRIMPALIALSEQWEIALAASGRSHLELLQPVVVSCLPTLCDADHEFELSFISGTNQGQESLAQAAVECLSHVHCSDATIASFFTALAHRIDLGPAFSLLLNGRQLPLDLLIRRMATVQFNNEQLTELAQSLPHWRAGWTSVLLMNLNAAYFLEDDRRTHLAVMMVDAVAAGAKPIKGTDDLANPRLSGWVEQALGAMLNVSVAGQPLLSDDALKRVMRAVVKDVPLAKSMLDWTEERRPEQKLRLHTAMVVELIDYVGNPAAAKVALLLINHPGILEEVVIKLDKQDQRRLFELTSVEK